MIDSLKVLLPVLIKVWDIVKVWWWLPLPFIFWRPFFFLLLWSRVSKFLDKTKMILLEIKIPKEVLKPIRAMDVVLDGLWQILYDPADLYEKWIEGKIIMSYSFEIASINGEPHFYIRIPKKNKDAVEAVIYAQYPDSEIGVAEDYTKQVPQDIPNKNWDFWGAGYRLIKENAYPIKTYMEFETEREALEEKRIDPIATLLESMAKIGPGEQLWVQITATPLLDEIPWVKDSEIERDKLAKRIESKKVAQRPILVEAADVLVSGNVPGVKKEEKQELLPPEMKLTQGEREILTGVERKMAKRGFHTNIRFIYLGRREVFFKPKLRLALSFFSNFVTQNVNGLIPYGQPFITKVPKKINPIKNMFRSRRLYLKKRQMLRRYKKRDHPLFPRERKYPSSFVLNTEELASLYHFPGRASAPAPFIKRIETKKSEAPPGLPTE